MQDLRAAPFRKSFCAADNICGGLFFLPRPPYFPKAAAVLPAVSLAGRTDEAVLPTTVLIETALPPVSLAGRTDEAVLPTSVLIETALPPVSLTGRTGEPLFLFGLSAVLPEAFLSARTGALQTGYSFFLCSAGASELPYAWPVSARYCGHAFFCGLHAFPQLFSGYPPDN